MKQIGTMKKKNEAWADKGMNEWMNELFYYPTMGKL